MSCIKGQVRVSFSFISGCSALDACLTFPKGFDLLVYIELFIYFPGPYHTRFSKAFLLPSSSKYSNAKLALFQSC